MATLTIPDETYGRLVSRAASLRVSLEELVLPLLEAEPEAPQLPLKGEAWQRDAGEWTKHLPAEVLDQSATAPQLPLKGEAWQRAFEAWQRGAVELSKTLPPGFRVNTDRDFSYPDQADDPE